MPGNVESYSDFHWIFSDFGTPGALTAMINWYRAVATDDLVMPAPKSLTVPTLILWGDKDIYVGPKLAEACAALCADVRVVHFPQAGHWLPHDEREAVTAELLKFLAT